MPYTICIIDDEEVSERMLSAILKIEGYEIISASNGKKAIELFKSKIPDLILLDVDMPEMTGLELISIIKAKQELKDIPVIFISAHVDLSTKIEGLDLGGIDFISKPFQNGEVISRVKVHLENSLLHKQLKELNNKKNKFLSIIAKDMKTNLDENFAKIQLFEDYLKANDTKSLKESLSNLVKHNQQTSNYLRNYWSRLETNQLQISPTPISLARITKEILAEHLGTIERKKIAIQNSFEQEDIYVFSDEYCLRIIMSNLLSNAVKFTNYHEFIQLNYTIDNEKVFISIINKGMFFTTSAQERVFNFEYHPEETTNEENKGSGLGLALAKELVAKANGEFAIEANGNLTEIKFSMPLYKK